MAAKIILGSELRLSQDLPAWITNRARVDLTFSNPKFSYEQSRGWRVDPKSIQDIKAYRKRGGTYRVARGYRERLEAHLKEFDVDYKIVDRTCWYEPTPYANKISLFPHQKQPVADMLQVQDGILQAPCGSGKSIMALDLICQWGQPSLVLAHTNQILSQWIQYIEDYTQETPGIIQGNQFHIQNITVASVMTLAQRYLSKEFLEHWGVVILDEAHHAPAYSFHSVLSQFPSRIRIGITATPRREDGLQGLLSAVVGPTRARVSHEELISSGFALRPTVHIVATHFRVSQFVESREDKLYAAIEDDVDRAILVAEFAYRNRRRSVLILSRRIRHLDHVYDRLFDIDPSLRVKVLTGRLSNKERKRIVSDLSEGKIQIVLATQLADEGLDIPRLDTVFLTFAGASAIKVEQQIGRIMRTYKGKKSAEIYDFVDTYVPRLWKQSQKRKGVYQRLHYPIVIDPT